VNSSDVVGSPPWNPPPPSPRTELPPWYDDGGKSWGYSDPTCYTPSPVTSGAEDLRGLLFGDSISGSLDDRVS